MPDSKESPNGLAPVARSSPRSLASVPPHFLDNTQAKLFGKWFLQILSVCTQHTLLLDTDCGVLACDAKAKEIVTLIHTSSQVLIPVLCCVGALMLVIASVACVVCLL